MRTIPRGLAGTALALGMAAIAIAPTDRPFPAPAHVPPRISDEMFWRMTSEFSEPGGYFRSDNLVSNELTFQHVIPELVSVHGTGGVYLGVGPDQNFTYLVALKPKIAFIVDIRRGNLQQHLLYKALIELAPERADFLSLLFSRPRPPGLSSGSTAEQLFAAFDSVAADSARMAKTLGAVRQKLVEGHHFPLDAADLTGIEYVLTAFYESGPQITYSFGTGNRSAYGGWRGMPTYAELMVQTDADGVARGYLANEDNYRALQELEANNLVIPIVGDFAGDKALRAVGEFLKKTGSTVSTIYTSNVEQYLFQSEEAWQRYYANVATLPIDARTTFIRAVFNYGSWRDPGAQRGPRSVTMLSSVNDILAAVKEGRVQSYWDVIQLSRSPTDRE